MIQKIINLLTMIFMFSGSLIAMHSKSIAAYNQLLGSILNNHNIEFKWDVYKDLERTYLGELEHRITTRDHEKLKNSLLNYPADRLELGQLFFNEHCDEAAILLLFGMGADINYEQMTCEPYSFFTPLHYFIWHNKIERAILLLSLGADASAENHLGQTAVNALMQEKKDDLIGNVDHICMFVRMVQAKTQNSVMVDLKDRYLYSPIASIVQEIHRLELTDEWSSSYKNKTTNISALQKLVVQLTDEALIPKEYAMNLQLALTKIALVK